MRILRIISRLGQGTSRRALQRFLSRKGRRGRLCYAGSGENAKWMCRQWNRERRPPIRRRRGRRLLLEIKLALDRLGRGRHLHGIARRLDSILYF